MCCAHTLRSKVGDSWSKVLKHSICIDSIPWSNLYSSGESAHAPTSLASTYFKNTSSTQIIDDESRGTRSDTENRVLEQRAYPSSWLEEGSAQNKFFKMSLGKYVGMDVAGIVDAVGSGVDNFFVGDEVFGIIDVGQSGSIAEYCICEADALHLTHKPKNLAWDKAAGSVVTYVTAYGALTDSSKAGMRRGDSVLIIGASGGCGLPGEGTQSK